MTIILQNGLDEFTPINWRGTISSKFRSKKEAINAMETVARTDRVDVFRVKAIGSRWVVQVGQPI
jgi:hypothetical protein